MRQKLLYQALGILIWFIIILHLCSCSQGQVSDEKIVLTIVTDAAAEITEAVRAFNTSHDNCEIQIESYTVGDGELLTTRLSTGDVPDMFCFGTNFFFGMSPFAPETYVAKGLMEDLYPYIDSDSELSRESFLQSVLLAAETESGHLYVLPSSFWIDVVVGDAVVVGDTLGWTFSDLEAVLAEYPNAKGAFGSYMTQYYLLAHLLAYNYDSFLDWEKGTCDFDSEEFRDLLRLAASHNPAIYSSDNRTEYDLIHTGEQILMYGKMGRVDAIQEYVQYFGTPDITFIGFPVSEGVGNCINYDLSFSISSSTQHGDICWEFIRGFLLDDYDPALFPVNNTAMQRRLEHLSEYEVPGANITMGEGETEFTVTFTEATAEQITMFGELVSSLDRVTHYDAALFGIVWDEAQSYFSGDRTVEETAALIQSRVSIYMAEQK